MPFESYDISSQTVLITGATSGIGQASAYAFAELGCKVIICGRRVERLNQTKANIEAQFSEAKVLAYPLDVTDSEACTSMPQSLQDNHPDFSEVDILVNNAGLAVGKSGAHEANMSDVQAMIATNVTGLITMSTTFLPQMHERRRGHLINVSSIAAHDMYPGGSTYNATKSAVTAYTYATRMDLVGTPIRVTAISPGMVETEFSIVRWKGDEAKAASTYDNIVVLKPEDVADNIIYSATRPLRVAIADIIVYPTNQGSGNGPTVKAGKSLGALEK